MRLRILLLVLTLLPALLSAQGQIKLDFGDAGDREVWTGDEMALPSSTQKAADQLLDIPASGKKVFVWDRKTGNVAVKPVSEIKGVWKVLPADYQFAGKVTVRVEHDGKRVAVAFVTLKDAAGERESQIDAGKNGEAVFFGVKPGNVAVTVKYNSKGADAEPAKQEFILKSKRSEADTTFVVTLSQDVETVGAVQSTGGGEPGKGSISISPPKQGQAAPQGGGGGGGNIFMRILIYLIALGSAAAAIYFGLRYMKENQDKVKDQLQKVGVQIPDPQDPAQQDPGPAPVPITPQPPQKILLDDADPNIPAAPVAIDPISSPSVAVAQPSLIMENGDVFPVPDGETSVGREAGNGLALVTESTVSRRHATVVKSGDTVTVRDDGSSNGTYVNGVKIASDTVLRPGDQVQFGQAKFRYEA